MKKSTINEVAKAISEASGWTTTEGYDFVASDHPRARQFVSASKAAIRTVRRLASAALKKL